MLHTQRPYFVPGPSVTDHPPLCDQLESPLVESRVFNSDEEIHIVTGIGNRGNMECSSISTSFKGQTRCALSVSRPSRELEGRGGKISYPPLM